MAIIICNECGGKVSENAEICPHCGNPVSNIKTYISKNRQYTIINGIKYDVTEIVKLVLTENMNNINKAGDLIRKNFDISPIQLIHPIYKNKCAPKELNVETLTEFNAKQRAIQASKPKCPMCGSTDISKISTLSRASSIVGFGILSKKIGKQWQCNNPKCKHMW